MFKKECFVMYDSGQYGYKNGISVIHASASVWIVIQHGKEVFRARTLKECKDFIGRRCD